MQRGDHLFYYRAGGVYSHHGIACGDGTVIHYESSAWLKLAGLLASGISPQVRRVSLDAFSLGAALSVRAYAWEDPVARVLERAESRLGEAAYHLTENNCEHFAVWCKTGETLSTQASAHQRARRLAMRGAPLGLLLVRSARWMPGPYRGLAYAGALAAAGGAYAGAYLACRYHDMRAGRS